MKNLKAIWFSEAGSMRPIGIVLGQDENTEELKAYIGTGDGASSLVDMNRIAQWGTHFPVDIAKTLIGDL
jgi:hypothetical protein